MPQVVKSEDCKQKVNFGSLKRTVGDLTLLDDMSSQLILHNLKRRFADGRIYTNVGTILISVNPYRSLDLCKDLDTPLQDTPFTRNSDH